MIELLVLIHTVPPLVDVFNRLGAERLPGVRLLHVLDEPLLEQVRRRGALAPEDTTRLASHVAAAAALDASAVLVTCSTISPCVDEVREHVKIPVVKIDEAMIAAAVRQGTRVGVVATNVTTLEPTRKLLEQEAIRVDRLLFVETVLVEGALPALLGGDGAAHDRLVRAAVLDLARRMDVVVLAQASMARVLAVLPEAKRAVPVLSSPHLALGQVRELFKEGKSQ